MDNSKTGHYQEQDRRRGLPKPQLLVRRLQLAPLLPGEIDRHTSPEAVTREYNASLPLAPIDLTARSIRAIHVPAGTGFDQGFYCYGDLWAETHKNQ